MAPPNDNFANAEALVGNSGSISTTNLNATSDGANDPLVNNGWGNKTVWYSFTASSAGELEVVLSNSGVPGINSDPVMGVFSGSSLATLLEIEEQDSDPDAGYSGVYPRVRAPLGSAGTYYIEVTGTTNTRHGTFQLTWTFTPASSATVYTAETQAYIYPAFDESYRIYDKDLVLVDYIDVPASGVESIRVSLDGQRLILTQDGDASPHYSGNVVILDRATKAYITDFLPTGAGSGQAPNATVNSLWGIAEDSNGRMFFAQTGVTQNGRIHCFDSSYSYVGTFFKGSPGATNWGGGWPGGVAVDPATNNIYVAYTESGPHAYIDIYDPSFTYITRFDRTGWTSTTGDNQFPYQMFFAPDGNLYVAGRHKISIFDASGTLLDEFGTFGNGPGEFDEAVDVAVTSSGDIYVADQDNSRIQKFDSSFNYITEHFAFVPSGVAAYGQVLGNPHLSRIRFRAFQAGA